MLLPGPFFQAQELLTELLTGTPHLGLSPAQELVRVWEKTLFSFLHVGHQETSSETQAVVRLGRALNAGFEVWLSFLGHGDHQRFEARE